VESVVPDGLTVGSRRLSGEDPRAAAVAEALGGPEPRARLLRLGVGWVAVEHGTPGTVPTGLLRDLDPVVRRGDVELYRVGGEPTAWRATAPRTPVLVAHLTALAVAGGAAVWLIAARLTRKEQNSLVQSGQAW
jgi:hypothetical protein